MQDFLFWWSVFSTILSLIFIGISIWQIVEGRKQKERSNAQVKIWMQDANGVTQGLGRIVRDNLEKRFSSTDDVCNAIWALHSSAFALYQSLYEERAVTEEEFKKQQKELAEEAKKAQQEANAQPEIISNPETARKKVKKTQRSSTVSSHR